MRVARLLQVMVLVALVIACSMTTLAYLSDRREADNTLAFGEVRVELQETGWGSAKTVQPGTRVSKDPKVKNTGNVPCYVRATVAVSDAPGGNQAAADFLEMGALGAKWQTSDTWGVGTPVVYYSEILDPGETTDPIFTDFLVKAQSGGGSLLEGANPGFSIIVTVEAVQTRAEGVSISTPQEAFVKLLGA